MRLTLPCALLLVVAPVASAQDEEAAVASTAQDLGINDVRTAAMGRAQIALTRMQGLNGDQLQARAKDQAAKIIDPELNWDQSTEIVRTMMSRLSPAMQVVKAPASDAKCKVRAAYVVGASYPIHLCPAFFSSSKEEKTRTLLHESAHLARINANVEGESYAPIFECSPAQPLGFNNADAWAMFINCASDQPEDPKERP